MEEGLAPLRRLLTVFERLPPPIFSSTIVPEASFLKPLYLFFFLSFCCLGFLTFFLPLVPTSFTSLINEFCYKDTASIIHANMLTYLIRLHK